jgi:hypothetical protein
MNASESARIETEAEAGSSVHFSLDARSPPVIDSADALWPVVTGPLNLNMPGLRLQCQARTRGDLPAQ